MSERLEDILNEWAQDLLDAITNKPWGIVIYPVTLEVSNDEDAIGFVWPHTSRGREPCWPELFNIYDYEDYLRTEHGYEVMEGPLLGPTISEREMFRAALNREPLEGSTTNRT